VSAARKCSFVKPDGTACRANAIASGDYCFFHDPTKATARKAAGAKGGRRSRKPAAALPADTPDVRVEDVAGVVRLLAETISQVRKGGIDPKVANATGYLSSVLLRALEGSELARQIEEQAAALAALKSELEAVRRERRHPQAPAAPAANGAGSAAHGRGDEPDAGGDPRRPGGDIPPGGDDAGPLAGDVAPFFQ
jgi:hypothetical protein